MTSIRLLADDLTGALDAAAEFVALTGPVQTFWQGAIPENLPASAVFDSATRERDDRTAAGIVSTLIHSLTGATIAFKKIDSLFRGPTIAELAACLTHGAFDRCVLAPAFPYQGRITRTGRQYARTAAGAWVAAGDDILTAFHTLGVAARQGSLKADLEPGMTIFDAETDDDLRRIVAHVLRCGHPVLWSGTGGLAQALTAEMLASATDIPDQPKLPQPVIGLFGSDQPAMIEQLGACEAHWSVLPDGGPASVDHVAHGLGTNGIVLASFDVQADMTRANAADHIARQIDQLTRALPPPGTLIVAGGETLRTLCQSLGATSLEVQGRIVPGVPRSIMFGGLWNGVTVVSKSGAFGHPHLLRDLLGLAKPNLP